MYYRFSTGTFIEAETFDEAKEKYIRIVLKEFEDGNKWVPCTCIGLSHRHDCPEKEKEGIPY